MNVFKTFRISPLRLIGKGFYSLGHLVSLWPIWLIVAFFISPLSPHLRWEYRYHDLGDRRIYSQCSYLGAQGRVFYQEGNDCPFIAFISNN